MYSISILESLGFVMSPSAVRGMFLGVRYLVYASEVKGHCPLFRSLVMKSNSSGAQDAMVKSIWMIVINVLIVVYCAIGR